MKKQHHLILILLLLIPLASSASLFSDIYVFGDSLSDTDVFKDGTNVRASNGSIWVEYLAPQLGLSYDRFDNFAQYGATTTEIGAQVSSYLTSTGGAADPDALYVLWGGPNDLFGGLAALDSSSSTFPDDLAAVIPDLIATGVTNTTAALTSLAGTGAMNILVPNMPNLGVTPGGILLDQFLRSAWPDLVGLGTFVSQQYNDALTAALLVNSLDVELLDVFTILTDVVNDPPAFGFSNVTDGCIGSTVLWTPSTGQINDPCTGYLYLDIVHPSTATHALLAQQMHAQLVPEPRTWALLASGLVLIGYRRRKISIVWR